MESPINPAVWKVLTHAAIGALSVATLVSIYHQKFDMEAVMREPFKRLAAAQSEEDKDSILHEILGRLQSDAVRKQSSSRMSAAKVGGCLVRFMKLEKDGSNAGSVSVALKVALRVFGSDAAGRRRLFELGGYKVLLSTLSEATRQENQDLMEETAEALRSLTEVDDSEIVLDTDVPEGAEGANQLAAMPATVKMLRILDPESPVLFLNAITGIFANLCTLSSGAQTVGKGVDGHSGMSFFLRLLEHTNHSVLENCVVTVRYMVRAGVGHEEVAQLENVQRLAEVLRSCTEPAIVNCVLTVVLVMAGSDKYAQEFLTNVAQTSLMNSMFDVWMRSPEHTLRYRAEMLCGVLVKTAPTAAAMAAIIQRFRPQIEERRAKDEQERQREMQQIQQNQMMQRMMMQQMGMEMPMD